MPRYLKILSLTAMFLLLAFNVSAEDFRFTWDPNHPNDNVTAYRMYIRVNSGYYDIIDSVLIKIDDVDFDPDNPSAELNLPDLEEGYCFALSAVDENKYESDLSAEIGTGSTCGENDAKFQSNDVADYNGNNDPSVSDDSPGCYIQLLLQ